MERGSLVLQNIRLQPGMEKKAFKREPLRNPARPGGSGLLGLRREGAQQGLQ